MDVSPPFETTIFNAVIFNDGDEVWMGVYEGGTVREFSLLSDYEGIYMDLAAGKFAFVEIQEGMKDQVWIKDICVFEVGKRTDGDNTPNNFGGMCISEILEIMKFPSDESDGMFQAFLTETRKAN